MVGVFQVSVPAVLGMSDVLAGNRHVPSGIGVPMRDSAAILRTGDPTLDAETRDLFDEFQALLDRLGMIFDYTAAALTEVADAASAYDADHAERLHQALPAEFTRG